MLYRKYRPTLFSEIVGQEHVVRSITGGLSSNRLGHAYLFCGPRGTGKTTMARVFAKTLNCSNFSRISGGNTDEKLSIRRSLGEGRSINPCNFCDSCKAFDEGRSLDLVEVDAASNRGIDEIRNLKESAMVSAPSGKHKIFIIDEVHMLTKDAFNALLKILEEPPQGLVLILATTEPHKLLPTVLSRVQRFDFRRIQVQQIVEKLKSISCAEKINIEDEGLVAIAGTADGALRDAEVALSKIMAVFPKEQKISAEDVRTTLGLIPVQYYPEFLNYLIADNKSEAVHFVQRLTNSGIDLENFSKNFLEHTRKVLISKVNPAVLASAGQDAQEISALSVQAQTADGTKLVRIINLFTQARADIKFSPIPQLPLELAILEL